MSNGSAVRALNDRQKDAHTDGTDFIPSTADAGGNNQNSAISLERFLNMNITHVPPWLYRNSSNCIVKIFRSFLLQITLEQQQNNMHTSHVILNQVYYNVVVA